MEYQISADNPNLMASLKAGKLQKSFVEMTLQGNTIRVAENAQFKKELEQDIASHFIFMLRTSFFSGSIEEISTFFDKYQNQFQISNAAYEKWKQIDELMVLAQEDINWADNKLKEIEDYKQSGVTHDEFDRRHADVMKSFLDKDFMRDTVHKHQAEEGRRARIEAEANVTRVQAQTHLYWLEEQKQKQIQFTVTLDQVKENWYEDHKTFENGKAFVDKVQNQQLQLFVERGWNSGTWHEELQQQMEIAHPFFDRLYGQYLICFKFQLDLDELYEMVLNNKLIKDILIEIAGREAEKPTLDAFIKHYQGEYEDAEHKLQNLAAHDELQRARKCIVNLNAMIHELNNGFIALNVDVRTGSYAFRTSTETTHTQHEINYVTGVSLNKLHLAIIHEDPYKIEYNQKTLLQQEIVKFLQNILNGLLEERAKLERCKQYLQELYAQPDQIRQKYAQIYQQESSGGQNLLVQIKQLLDLSQKQDFNELQFKKERMFCLVGALSDRLVIKRDTSCMCCSGQKMHVADSIFYTDYEKSIASEFRRLTNAQNKWNITPSQRIQQTDNLPSVKTTSFLMSNNSILSSLRTDDGQRQVSNGVRNFNVNRSIVFTINELCQLIVVEQKLKMNMKSPTIDQKISRWQKLQLDAQSGGKAHNRIELAK